MIFPFGEEVLKSYDFSDILFAKLGVAEYHYAKHNITAKQYNSPNVMRRINLPKCSEGHLGKVCRFLFYILEAVLFEPLNKRDFISIVISCISVKV